MLYSDRKTQQAMFDSNAVSHRYTFEFGLLREQHYSNFKYCNFLGTEGSLPAFRLHARLAPVRWVNFDFKERNKMEPVIDYLAEELKTQDARREATQSRKAGKVGRIDAMLKTGLANIEAQPMSLDFLGD